MQLKKTEVKGWSLAQKSVFIGGFGAQDSQIANQTLMEELNSAGWRGKRAHLKVARMVKPVERRCEE